MSDPGMKMYSDAWMEKHAPAVPKTFWPMIKEICSGWELGNNNDPLMIWNVIRKHMINFLDDFKNKEKEG